MKPYARYEILLPLRYNDGTPVEAEKLEETKRELVNKFGGLTVEPGTIQGFWVYQGTVVEDHLVRLVVDVEDTPENEQFFHEWKEELKERFRQEDIWITAHPLRIL